MTIVAVCAAGGTSASTTTSLLLAALLPRSYPAFMAECDPAGVAALGIEPAVWHVNEGHAALSLLERLSGALADGVELEQAKKQVSASTLFTLHTPVPAGNEVFDRSLALPLLSGNLPGIDDELLTSLTDSHAGGQFDMGALAIRLSSITNGVSQRHGKVVTHEWSGLIGGEAKAITNGIHPQTWVGRSMSRLYQRTVGEVWDQQVIDGAGWEAVRDVPAEELWNAHQSQKTVMLRRMKARLQEQYSRHGFGPSRLEWLEQQLPDDRLTIVFARRFATYKRAGLFFSDPHRVRQLLVDPARPVQIIFAGKAHPADKDGQAVVRWVFEMSQSPDLAGHVFFIENYDMAVAASLVRGADVWLNTPTPPKEASGTSGMKAAANGAINLSVLDGWWNEGYNGKNGWGFSESLQLRRRGRRHPLPPAGDGSRPPLLRPRRKRGAAGVGGDDEGVDPLGPPAVLDAADACRLRRTGLHPARPPLVTPGRTSPAGAGEQTLVRPPPADGAPTPSRAVCSARTACRSDRRGRGFCSPPPPGGGAAARAAGSPATRRGIAPHRYPETGPSALQSVARSRGEHAALVEPTGSHLHAQVGLVSREELPCPPFISIISASNTPLPSPSSTTCPPTSAPAGPAWSAPTVPARPRCSG